MLPSHAQATVPVGQESDCALVIDSVATSPLRPAQLSMKYECALRLTTHSEDDLVCGCGRLLSARKERNKCVYVQGQGQHREGSARPEAGHWSLLLRAKWQRSIPGACPA